MAKLTGSLTLTRAHVAPVGDHTQDVAAGTAGAVGGGSNRNDETTQAGSFRAYANGNVRLILGSQRTRTLTVALRAVPPSALKRLDAMVGKTCIFRDTYGRKVFGAFLGYQATDIPLSGHLHDDSLGTDVLLTFQNLTYSEAK